MERVGWGIGNKSNLGPNWRQLDSTVTSREIGAIKDILPNSGQIGGNPGKLPREAFPDAGIRAGGLRSDALLSALSHIPAQERLTILEEPCSPTADDWFPPRDERFLEQLHFSQGPESDPVVCPRLKTIELYNFNVVSDETLLQFVRSRTEPQHQGVTRLSRVLVQFGRLMDLDIKSCLQDAIAGGLVMDLS
ncbi:hypothetical protein B0H14DRAFT_2614381 [Mycena olivaceomarginata]|nr:hypothetical protein B0H14DRAFT_2614381 [Mycena olivaceomarginata]